MIEAVLARLAPGARPWRHARDPLAAVPVDLAAVSPFARRVYTALRDVPPGSTVSYGELARRAGSPGGARAIGRTMAQNPIPLVIPCHRVLAAGGKPGGFSAPGGVATKEKLLALEGLALAAEPFDPAEATAAIARVDPTLRRVVRRVGPFAVKLGRERTTFETLAKAIAHQQLSGAAAKTIWGRFQAQFPDAEAVLAAPQEALRGVGLSRAKAAAIHDLASRVAAGSIPDLAELRRLTDERVIDVLTQVRGVGRWTVEMLLIFRLGRPDVLPVDDYALRKAAASLTGRGDVLSPIELAALGERWRPHRSVASWYLWRSLDQS
ncbi:MAG: methylated-DNA--[protein]-cysteine S-methyltransferase [Myxococcales bacterium]|nr:methylated-DNA--[protein]-cysteine S-methyltransferase [Myxococcales bacterium]